MSKNVTGFVVHYTTLAMKKIILALVLFLLAQGIFAVELPRKIFNNLLTDEKKDFFSVEDKKYKVVVFLSPSCPCTEHHLPHLNELAKKFSDVDFLAVDSNKIISKKESQEYFTEQKVNFPIIEDFSLELANAFGAIKTPQAFLIDQKGNVLYQGGVSTSTDPLNPENPGFKDVKWPLMAALENLKNGQKIQVPESKALGCYITR